MATHTTPALGPVLDLIERWQQNYDYRPDLIANEKAMLALDIAALKALAEQHAAQLRTIAMRPAGPEWEGDAATAMEAAADFLCAPRREPEAE
jgi:hypothetical protein